MKVQSLGDSRQYSKRTRRQWKSTTIATYVGVFLFIITVVAVGYEPPKSGSSDNVANATTTQHIVPVDQQAAAPSVDQLVATRVAAGIAERAELPIARNVANLSLSLSVESELAQAEDNVVVKPQIIQPSAGDREIRSYKTVAGDTVEKLSDQFSVSVNTIKWANGLTSDLLEPGKTLQIPRVNGIVYTVKDGDTTASIASKYGADEKRIVLYNDLDLGGLSSGQKIVLPDGDLPETERPGYVAPRPVYTSSSYGSNGGIVGGYSSSVVGNRYAYGNCTYYVYNRRAAIGRPIGSFWGNAATWAAAARGSGYLVDRTPEPGAVAQWSAYADAWIGYAGHVGIVETVNGDGTVTISEMNNVAFGGFNIVNRRTIPANAVSAYIH